MVAREHSDTPHSGRVVYWNSHESVKCPVGADAWHARFGHGKVLASRGRGPTRQKRSAPPAPQSRRPSDGLDQPGRIAT